MPTKRRAKPKRPKPEWRLADVDCPSQKKPYLTYRDAEVALAQVVLRKRMEQRIYECDGSDGLENPCGYFHLTKR